MDNVKKNVYFYINRYVLLGNHRDAWTFGAVDPNSGTAALLEVSIRLLIFVRMVSIYLFFVFLCFM